MRYDNVSPLIWILAVVGVILIVMYFTGNL
jgi:hypothetical protein